LSPPAIERWGTATLSPVYLPTCGAPEISTSFGLTDSTRPAWPLSWTPGWGARSRQGSRLGSRPAPPATPSSPES
jgi:hypothetical protein